MSTEMVKVRNPRLLNLAVYLIVIFMAIVGASMISGGLVKAAILALSVLFCLAHAWGFPRTDTPRRLALYFLVQASVILTLLRLSRPSDLFILFFYILALEAVTALPVRYALAWIAGFFLIGSLNQLWNQGQRAIISIFFYAAAFLMTAVFGYALRQAEIARRKNEELLEALTAAQQKVRELAVTEERGRMAREMHDSLGHRLTVTIVQLEGAQRLIPTDPERAARMIGNMRDEMKEALAELRRTVSALRVPIAEEKSLDIALSTLSQAFQQNTGIPTHFTVSPGFPGLPETHRLAFYRTAQEALTNIQRHAMAQNAWLQLRADDQQVTLILEDDGKGLNEGSENKSGSGLLGMRERAVQLGGEVHLADRLGGGTQLILTVPLPTQGEKA
jgi:signal transduction histidine kinase